MSNESMPVGPESSAAPDPIEETEPAPAGGLLKPPTSTEPRQERTREYLAYGCFVLVSLVVLSYLVAAFRPGLVDTAILADARNFVSPIGVGALAYYFAKSA